MAPAPISVAVLYFESRSGDTNDLALADGLTEEIIGRLSGIERLTVRSRYLVRRYRSAPVDDPAAVARSLNVTYLVSGTVRRSGGRLRVNAELIRAAGGAQVWGQQFDQAGGDVVARPADGSGPDRRLAHLDRQIQEFSWSRDGQWILLCTDNSQAGAGDILGIRTSGDSTPVPLVASSFSELHPALSPDGRWLAYTSNESGVNEVYVRPFPNTGGGRSQVSNGGGSEPRWSGDGRALFFLDATLRTLIEARVTTAPTFAVSGLRPLFATSGFLVDAFQTSYDVTRDGRFFIFVSPRQAATRSRAPQVVRVDNWFSDLRARLAL